MTVTVKDQRTKKEIVCCLAHAATIVGLEENSLRRRLNPECEYRHFLINSNVEQVKKKPRGVAFSKQNNT